MRDGLDFIKQKSYSIAEWIEVFMSIKELLKCESKCDMVSLAGVAVFAALFIANIIKYAVIASPVAFIAEVAVCALFLLCAVFTFRSRLSALWLVIGAGSFVLFICTNYFTYFANAIYFIMFIVSFAVGVWALVYQIREKVKPTRFAYVSLSLTLALVVFAGGFWVGNFVSVNAENGRAQSEVWAVPDKFDAAVCPEPGSLVHIEYDTKAYATNMRAVKKSAIVYLPYNYDQSQKYDILYLMHGTMENETYWLEKVPENKTMVDNLIYYGEIKPLIIVTPSWYTENDCADDLELLTYAFKDELRNDLMPYVESRWTTYSDKQVTAEAFVSSRDHRAFAGLSRGSSTTFHSAFNKCLDYFSYFGAFSGCMTAPEEFEEGSLSNEFKNYTINYLYNTSGSFDFLLAEHLQGFDWLLQNDVRLKENQNCSFDVFPTCNHSSLSWHIALYNALQLFFK